MPVPVFQVVATFRSGLTDGAGPDLQCLVGGPYLDGTCFLGAALLRPASRGSVRLSSPDPATPPRIDLAYFARHEMFARERDGVGNALIVGWMLLLAAVLAIRYV